MGREIFKSRPLLVINEEPGNCPMVVRLHGSQTGNGLEVQNSAGTVIARVDSSGVIYSYSAVAGGPVAQTQTIPPLAPRLMALLNAGQRSAKIVVLSDSTGRDDTASGSPATGWVRRTADYLAALFPAYTVKYYQGAASGSYDFAYGAATTIQTGTAGGSAPVLDVYNGSIGGKDASYYLGLRLVAAVKTVQPDLVLISYGHNNTTDTTNQWWWPYFALAQATLYEAPSAELGLVAQNPAVSPAAYTTEQQARVSDIARIARIMGVPMVNVCQVFTDAGAATYINTDGVHPNSLGQALWASVITSALVKGLSTKYQASPAISGLHKVGSNLVTNGGLTISGSAIPSWTLNNVTVSQDSTNFERSSPGYAAKLTHTAQTGFGAYINQNIDARQCKGRWVTAVMRYYAPSGQTADLSLARFAISDGVQSSALTVSNSNANLRDGWATAVVSLLVDASASTVDVRVYVDTDSSAGAVGSNITVQDVVVVIGAEPRGLLATPSPVASPVVLTSAASTETPLTVNARTAGQTNDVVQVYDTTGALGSRVVGSNSVWEFTKGFTALLQGTWTVSNTGATVITRRTGDSASLGRFYIDSNGKMLWNGSASANSHDTTLERSAANLLATGTDDGLSIGQAAGTGTGFLQMWEQSADAAAPATDSARLYCKDVGGKTALFVRFPTGAVQQIAIEP